MVWHPQLLRLPSSLYAVYHCVSSPLIQLVCEDLALCPSFLLSLCLRIWVVGFGNDSSTYRWWIVGLSCFSSSLLSPISPGSSSGRVNATKAPCGVFLVYASVFLELVPFSPFDTSVMGTTGWLIWVRFCCSDVCVAMTDVCCGELESSGSCLLILLSERVVCCVVMQMQTILMCVCGIDAYVSVCDRGDVTEIASRPEDTQSDHVFGHVSPWKLRTW